MAAGEGGRGQLTGRPRGCLHCADALIGTLFAIGSTCFVIGPIPAYARTVGTGWANFTFFFGSLFFTSAAYLSYRETLRAPGPSPTHRWFGIRHEQKGFAPALIQFVGTLLFNVTTFAAMLSMPLAATVALVWRPDAYGSVCFLASSALACAEAGRRYWTWRGRDGKPGTRDQEVAVWNWWGSVFFGVSAVGAFLLSTGQEWNAPVANLGTSLGGICFLIASLLMIPSR